MVPTFLGSTILVFIILQIAPGGPIERAIMEMQMGGEESGVSASGELGGSVLPESALKELKRFYGFDKPIYQNITLGSYILNDPIVKSKINIIKIKKEKQKLLNEIEALKNG